MKKNIVDYSLEKNNRIKGGGEKKVYLYLYTKKDVNKWEWIQNDAIM